MRTNDNVALLPEVDASPEPGASTGTLAQLALAKIVDLIRKGELRPGQVVNEADLSKTFRMSRGPVREAIKQLEGRKLVTREAYQRARVVELDLKQIRHIFELRECLEGMACRLATRHMSEEDLAAFAADVERAQTPDNYSFVFSDWRFNFHEAVVNFSGNPRIREILCSELYDLVRLHRWSAGTLPARYGPGSREHWQICRAMMARDEDLAESLMRSHIQRVMGLVAGLG